MSAIYDITLRAMLITDQQFYRYFCVLPSHRDILDPISESKNVTWRVRKYS